MLEPHVVVQLTRTVLLDDEGQAACAPAGNDDRSQTIIDNCISEGVDPYTLGADGAPSVGTVSGGADDLRPETSDSWTVGFVFGQPWTEAFDFQVSLDYTSIEITVSTGAVRNLATLGVDPENVTLVR